MTSTLPSDIFTNITSFLKPFTILFELTSVSSEWYNTIHTIQFWNSYNQIVNKYNEQHPYHNYTNLVAHIESNTKITQKQVDQLNVISRLLKARVDGTPSLFIPLQNVPVVRVDIPYRKNGEIRYISLYLQLDETTIHPVETSELLHLSYLQNGSTILSSNQNSEAQECHTAQYRVTYVDWHGSTTSDYDSVNDSVVHDLFQYIQVDDITTFLIPLLKAIYRKIIGLESKSVPQTFHQNSVCTMKALSKIERLYDPGKLLSRPDISDNIVSRITSCGFQYTPSQQDPSLCDWE
jgi:hypothetical protein